MPVKGLVERLKNPDEFVIVGEGYLFEFERRCYLKAGSYVPEIVLKHPDLVESMHREFVHAGSDVVLAFTYYGHRAKMRLIGLEQELEPMNRKALQIAKKVADETETLMAGDICNTTVYDPADPKTFQEAYDMLKEQVVWAAQEGADYILGETFSNIGEAELALKAIKEFGNGCPAVVLIVPYRAGKPRPGEGTFAEQCQKLESLGADVVGMNCGFGPETIFPHIKEVRAAVKGPVGCLPVGYRTNKEYPVMQALPNKGGTGMAFPDNLEQWYCSRDQFAEFATECKKIGVNYVGVCCGGGANYIRAMAEALGRKVPASKYSADMSMHYQFGKTVKDCNVRQHGE